MLGALLAIGTALIESSRDIYLSSAQTRTIPHVLRAFLLPLFSLPLVIVVVLVMGIPPIAPGFWVYVSVHALLMVAANYCYLRALAVGAVSETQPMLGLTTVFLIVTTPLLTDDTVTLVGWAGVLVVALGIYAVQHPGIDFATGVTPSFWSPFVKMWSRPGVLWMFVVAIIYSVTSNLDKLAVLASSAPVYLVVDYALTALFTLLLIVVMVVLGIVPQGQLRGMGGASVAFLPAGFLTAGGALLQMVALLFLPVPYVIAFKRLSIVFTSLWGYFARRERAPHWFRILGAILVVIGVVIILIFGKM
jgi:drug/metabolite transporter (DMT)-like permease